MGNDKNFRISFLILMFSCIFLYQLPCLVRTDGIDGKFTLVAINDISSHKEKENDATPVFSPDGKKLAYVRYRPGKWELWILDLETFREKRVQASLDEPREYSLSSDGEAKSKGGISWAPDSRFFVFTGQLWNLYLGCVDMDVTFRLTNHPKPDIQPNWSPDGQYIVFVSGTSGEGDIYLIKIKEVLDKFSSNQNGLDLSGAVDVDLINLTENSNTFNYGPNWHHDSKSIVYHSDSINPNIKSQQTEKGMETSNIKRISWSRDPKDPSDRKTAMITNWAYFQEMHPSYSPKGDYVAFYSNLLNPFDLRAEVSKSRDTNAPSDQFTLYCVDTSTESKAELPFPISGSDKWVISANTRINVNYESGPAWQIDKDGLWLIYSEINETGKDKNGKKIGKDPIYRVSITNHNNDPELLNFGTQMNRNLAVCKDGSKIAFIAQDDSSKNLLYIAIIHR